MNLNELAKEVAKLEGGKKNLSIAQIKEVIKCLSILIYEDCVPLFHGNKKSEIVNRLYANGKRHSQPKVKKRAGKK